MNGTAGRPPVVRVHVGSIPAVVAPHANARGGEVPVRFQITPEACPEEEQAHCGNRKDNEDHRSIGETHIRPHEPQGDLIIG